MAIAGSLVVLLEARTSQLENELRRARGFITRLQKDIAALKAETGSTERQINQNAGRIAAAFGGLTTSVNRTTAALTGLVSVGTAVQALQIGQKALENADSLKDMAEQVDISVESLQRLRLVAESTGGSADLMDRALNTLNDRLGEAARGSTEAQQRFADLGLRWQDLRGIPVDRVLLVVADALRQFENQSDRASRASGLFGDRSRALLNALNLGSQGIEQAGRRLDRFRILLSEETVQALAQTNDELEDLARVVNSRVSRAIADLAPVIERILVALRELVVSVGDNTTVLATLPFLASRLESSLTDLHRILDLTARTMAVLERAWNRLRSVFGGAPDTLDAVNERIRELQQGLEVAGRQPANERTAAKILELTQALAQAQDRQRAMLEAPIFRPEGPAAPPPPAAPAVPIRRPFPIPGAERGGRGGRSITEQLTAEARDAAGVFKTFEAAITAIEREIRTLEPTPAIVEDLDAAAQAASVTFTSWVDAIRSLEAAVREPFADYSAAILRANEQIRAATEATRDSLAGQAESLNAQYQTPLERLREFQQQLEDMQGLLDRGIAPRALREAQLAYARTTLAGQTLTLVAEGIGDAFEQSFQAVIAGTLSVSEAFRNLAQSILLSISRLLLQKGIEALLNIVLTGIARGAVPVQGGTSTFQRGGVVPGPRGAGDRVPAFLTPGEFVVRQPAVAAVGLRTLERLNALGYQQGGPVVPSVGAAPVMARAEPPVVNVIVVRSDAEAEAKRRELEAFDQRVVAIVSKNIQGGDGSIINRSLNMVRGPRG